MDRAPVPDTLPHDNGLFSYAVVGAELDRLSGKSGRALRVIAFLACSHGRVCRSIQRR
ncbi:hypothetical protein [Streptomyces canus]|uniref:hypothetical protein n=1 Tax=Streptomyces canus TaxID=58343 RepID=UPI0022583B8B|nr:hypothetical protein [Streptomyces canus]